MKNTHYLLISFTNLCLSSALLTQSNDYKNAALLIDQRIESHGTNAPAVIPD